MRMANFRVCTSCRIHHIENCGTCFGFGVKAIEGPDGPVPITAGEAHDGTYCKYWIPCPECGSTPKGLPAGLPDNIVLDSIEKDSHNYAIQELKSRHADEYLELVATYANALRQAEARENERVFR
jgi:hypothetical protein